MSEVEERAIFVANQHGPSELWDDQGKIGEFKQSNSNLIKLSDGFLHRNGNDLWYMILTGKELIERARALEKKSKKLRFQESLGGEPVFNTLNNLMHRQDPNSANNLSIDLTAKAMELAKDQIEKERTQNATDMRRYGELYNQICKAGGDYLANADPQLVAEYEELQKKHGIKEEKDEK